MRRLIALACLAYLTIGLSVSAQEAANPDRPVWLRYPAVSPDGTRVAFCWGGQIWVSAVTGGEAAPLTSALFYSKAPFWSPDGEYIAFSSDRFGKLDVFIVRATGGEIRRLTYTSVDDSPTGFSADGTLVYFSSRRLGDAVATFHDGGIIGLQLYAVPATGGRERLVIPTPAVGSRQDATGDRFIYESISSPEQPWRKHAVSDATRDIWLYDQASRSHRALTSYRGEDRNPVWSADGKSFYFLSERSGSSNVWQQDIEGKSEPRQVTKHETHPVRFLSAAKDDTLVYSFDGELWCLKSGASSATRIPVRISQSSLLGGEFRVRLNDEVSEMAVSPSGLEYALIARGEVFVVSTSSGATRRITNTPSRECSVSFSPDGRALLYAAERNGSWGLYESRLVRPTDSSFVGALEFSEVVARNSEADETQGVYSPDGKRIAYLENRDLLRVYEVETGVVRSLSGQYPSYSYEDGDISFVWSPDGRLIAATSGIAGNGEVFLIDASGNRPPVNISRSGASDGSPVFSPDSQTLYWATGRHGLRSPIGEAVHQDIYAAFLTGDAYERWVSGEPTLNPPAGSWTPDFTGQSHRTVRLTPSAMPLVRFAAASASNQLILFIDNPLSGLQGFCLDAKSGGLSPLPEAPPAGTLSMVVDPSGSAIHYLTQSSIQRTGVVDGQSKAVPFAAEASYNLRGEMAYVFDHVVRFTEVKFYDTKMHGVDWRSYAARYREFLPSITRWQDMGDLLGELVGELNASHTAGSYRRRVEYGDATASLGLYFDSSHGAAGMKIARVLRAGPSDRPGSSLQAGAVIVAINGVEITPEMGADQLLNHQAGQRVRLTVEPSGGGEKVEEVVTPITFEAAFVRAYEQWVNERKEMTRALSGGRIGYVHVAAMNSPNFERASSELFGEYADAEAVVLDVRFNLGGNLHDQLITMLTGERAGRLISNKGVAVANVPEGRWGRPSAVLANAASYSDGSVFPHFYKANGIGPLIGERVPGTGTAVWWEHQLEPNLVYGVPELGFRDLKSGKWLENLEIQPDILVYNTPQAIAEGRDEQLEVAVQVLLKQLGQ